MPDTDTKKDKKIQSSLKLDLGSDVTDKALFVRTSEDEMERWDTTRISESIVKETGISARIAGEIAQEVENQIFEGKIKNITARLIRELVLGKLTERGLEEAHKRYSRLGFPIYDVQQIIENETNKDNANVPHGPEATNLTLAEGIKKEYALLRVFSQDISDAHARGDIHIHDLGMIDRPYCSGQSLEYVKKYGLDLTSSLSQARPAKHAEVLIAHLIKLSAALQCHFSGAIGWDAVNVFLAPYLVGRDEKEIKQLAQILIYEFSQQAVARGGQAIFSDINLYWEVPVHFRDVQAIGPGGKYTGKTYKDYIKESQAFFKGLFEVYLDGDGSGRPFFFPKPLVHITEKFFNTPGHEECLEFLSRKWRRKRATPTLCSTAARRPRSPSAAAWPLSWKERHRRCQETVADALFSFAKYFRQFAAHRLSGRRQRRSAVSIFEKYSGDHSESPPPETDFLGAPAGQGFQWPAGFAGD